MPLDKKSVSDVENLLERLTRFSEKIIDLVQKLPKTMVNIPLIQQLVPAATSIGANYNETFTQELESLRSEANEYVLIFSSIVSKFKK